MNIVRTSEATKERIRKLTSAGWSLKRTALACDVSPTTVDKYRSAKSLVKKRHNASSRP